MKFTLYERLSKLEISHIDRVEGLVSPLSVYPIVYSRTLFFLTHKVDNDKLHKEF